MDGGEQQETRSSTCRGLSKSFCSNPDREMTVPDIGQGCGFRAKLKSYRQEGEKPRGTGQVRRGLRLSFAGLLSPQEIHGCSWIPEFTRAYSGSFTRS